MSEDLRNRMAELASGDYARRTKSARDLHEIFEQPADASPVELIYMAFAMPRPKIKTRERKLIDAHAATLADYEHVALAELAATTQLEVMRLRSIFARFVEYTHNMDKARKVIKAANKDLFKWQEEEIPKKFPRSGGLARHPKKRLAMKEIRAEFDRWECREVNYKNDSDFANKMFEKHRDVLENEGSIKNAVARWRKEKKTSC